MGRSVARAALLAVSVMACERAALAADVMRTRVNVRVYDAGGVPPALRANALGIAGATLRAALVDVTWLPCPTAAQGGRQGDVCAVPLAAGDLVLRLAAGRGAAKDERQALGAAVVDPREGRAVLATVFYDRVVELSVVSGADLALLLGRTVAHELGHLLMASTDHAASGIMRPHWTRDDIRRARARDWSFREADTAAIRRQRARVRAF